MSLQNNFCTSLHFSANGANSQFYIAGGVTMGPIFQTVWLMNITSMAGSNPWAGMHVYIGFKTFIYVVRHLDSIASYLPTGLHLGFFRSWPNLFLPSSFYSVFLVLSFAMASTSMLFWALLPFFEHGRTM